MNVTNAQTLKNGTRNETEVMYKKNSNKDLIINDCLCK